MTKDWPVKSHTRFRYSPRTYRKVNPRLPVPIDLGDERITVAVGTTIADRRRVGPGNFTPSRSQNRA